MGGPGMPCTKRRSPAPGVEPPLPERSPSEPSGCEPLARLLAGLPGRRKSVSWEVKPESCEEMEDSRSGATSGLPGPF